MAQARAFGNAPRFRARLQDSRGSSALATRPPAPRPDGAAAIRDLSAGAHLRTTGRLSQCRAREGKWMGRRRQLDLSTAPAPHRLRSRTARSAEPGSFPSPSGLEAVSGQDFPEQILPGWVRRLDQLDLPCPQPALHGSLASCGDRGVVVGLVVDEPVRPVAFAEAFAQMFAMLTRTITQVARHAHVERASRSARENIDIIGLASEHAQSVAPTPRGGKIPVLAALGRERRG